MVLSGPEFLYRRAFFSGLKSLKFQFAPASIPRPHDPYPTRDPAFLTELFKACAQLEDLSAEGFWCGCNEPLSSAVLQSHQVPLSSIPHSQVPSAQQQSYGGSVTSPILTQSYMNGVTATHSQTPYGPHVSSTSIGSTLGVPNGNLTNSSQEEISTIFVVGFPDDMQVCVNYQICVRFE